MYLIFKSAKIIFSFFLLSVAFFPVFAQKKITRPPSQFVSNEAFTYGEKLTYTIAYNIYFNINVAELTMMVKPEPKMVYNKPHYHIVADGKSYPFYDAFFKVRDRYESVIDPATFLPIISIRIINEGNYHSVENYVYNYSNMTLKNKKGKLFQIPMLTQDILSSIYLARTFDYSNCKKGDSFMINVFIDDSTYYVGVKFMGRETLKLKSGTYNCIKLQPILIVDRVFKSEDDMILWVTDDKNKIPVKVFSGISVGNVTATLTGYSGLKNKINVQK